MVAHRLSTIQDADQIIVLKNGKIDEIGTHIELMEKPGVYAKLVSLQFSECGKQNSKGLQDPSVNFQKQESVRFNSVEETQKVCSTSSSKKPTPSLKELAKLNKPEWPYAVFGSLGAVLTGIQVPLFALGITNMLTAFYSNNDATSKQDVQVTAFAFLLVAAITVPIYLLQQYFYTVMGERITARMRLAMFSGLYHVLT